MYQPAWQPKPGVRHVNTLTALRARPASAPGHRSKGPHAACVDVRAVRGDTEAEHRRMGPGRLVLKGGEPLGGIQKKKAKKPKKVGDVAEVQDGQVEEASASVVDPSAPKPVDPAAVNVMSGKKYEEEFEFEKLRRETGKARSTPWGSTYRQAPEILHGYTKKVLGVTAEERLDIRASTKADKFC
ncbi:uncharacterized protein HaLaN_22034, partial [Haematococcus lacustris]